MSTPSARVSRDRSYPVFPRGLPETVRAARYVLDFARSTSDVEAAQRLRFEVFNLELGEGLDGSYATGRDEDRFDPVCHHLMVSEADSGKVVGTYRMQTTEMARQHVGFYSADEFALDGLPAAVLENAIEVGRACVAREYRNRHVLFLLWRGLADYMRHNGKRYLFGCCSLTSQDPAQGKRVMDHLEREGLVRTDLRVVPQPSWTCYPEGFELRDSGPGEVRLPKLFSLYLRYGARVCGPPAIDRLFKTIDYLVLLDIEDLDPESHALFFG